MPESKYIFLEINIGSYRLCYILIQLYNNKLSLSVSHFSNICLGNYENILNKNCLVSYKGCKIFKIVPDQYVSAGDIRNNDGTDTYCLDENINKEQANQNTKYRKGDLVLTKVNNKYGSVFSILLSNGISNNSFGPPIGRLVNFSKFQASISNIPTNLHNKPLIIIYIANCGKATNEIEAKIKNWYSSLEDIDKYSYLLDYIIDKPTLFSVENKLNASIDDGSERTAKNSTNIAQTTTLKQVLSKKKKQNRFKNRMKNSKDEV